jgi:hypothetical protein
VGWVGLPGLRRGRLPGRQFRWDENFYANRLGQRTPALIEQLLTTGPLNDGETLDYAFGLRLSTFRGLPMVSHGGSFVGFRAEMIRFPEQRLSVACLCNSSTADPSRLARQVAEVYLAGEFPEAAAKEEDAGEQPARSAEVPGSGLEPASYGPDELRVFTGRYHSAELDTVYRVEIVDDTLVVHGPAEPLTLRPGVADIFSGTSWPVTFHFGRDPEGAVSGIRVSAGRVRNLTFVRRP